ncbi:MAG: hypothetical protein QOE36_192 [Gaiellaceae bacterium]|nr:hypothetical protein [Gaiellaceae bacterium]
MKAIRRVALIGVVLGIAALLMGSRARTNERIESSAAFDTAFLARDGRAHVQLRALRRPAWIGGPVTTSTGETVKVFVSATYSDAPAVGRHWAEFFVSLAHGNELGLLNAYIAPPSEVAQLCGGERILGCYGGGRLLAPGEPSDGLEPEAIAAHEYGHHVAANRSNAPWRALDWGTKRWATYEEVCARTSAGTAFPGDEGAMYALNPGEAFAETYRELNRPTTPLRWLVADPSFVPDAAALDAVREDVVAPWQTPAARAIKGGLRGTGTRRWQRTLATPLDGDVSVALSFPLGGAYALTARAADGTVLAAGASTGTGRMRLALQICGQRTVVLRVVRLGAPGAFTLRIAEP